MLFLFGCALLSAAPPPAPTAAPAPAAPLPATVPEAVLLDDVGALRAGTPVTLVALATVTTAYGETLPVTRKVRAAGAEVDVPAGAVALRDGEPLSGDLDGDGVVDRVWRAASVARTSFDDEVYPRELRQVVVAEVGGRVLVGPERIGGGCSGEVIDTVTLADATGDGRLDVVVTADSYVCEAGYDGATWEVLRPGARALERVGSVTVPQYPLVGRVNVGHVWWWPGGVRAVVIEPAPRGPAPGASEGPLRRTERRWTWVRGALAGSPPGVGPVTATRGGVVVEVLDAGAGDSAATVSGAEGERVPHAELTYTDAFFAAALDNGGGVAIEPGAAP